MIEIRVMYLAAIHKARHSPSGTFFMDPSDLCYVLFEWLLKHMIDYSLGWSRF